MCPDESGSLYNMLLTEKLAELNEIYWTLTIIYLDHLSLISRTYTFWFVRFKKIYTKRPFLIWENAVLQC